MKQKHIYELNNEEIKSVDKLIRAERQLGFEIEDILHYSNPHDASWGSPYSILFKQKESKKGK